LPAAAPRAHTGLLDRANALKGTAMNLRLKSWRLLCALGVLSAAGPAGASCHWEWLCNGEGNCKQMPICDSVYETPPPRPDTAPPQVPPLSMRPHRITANMGAMNCEHIMRQTMSGRWTWAEACFCTDPTKTKDPSTPFANIVRCQAPWKEDAPTTTSAPTAPGPTGKSNATATASNK
jgi:hypothetical protein